LYSSELLCLLFFLPEKINVLIDGFHVEGNCGQHFVFDYISESPKRLLEKRKRKYFFFSVFSAARTL
jgi:hypothetical protein